VLLEAATDANHTVNMEGTRNAQLGGSYHRELRPPGASAAAGSAALTLPPSKQSGSEWCAGLARTQREQDWLRNAVVAPVRERALARQTIPVPSTPVHNLFHEEKFAALRSPAEGRDRNLTDVANFKTRLLMVHASLGLLESPLFAVTLSDPLYHTLSLQTAQPRFTDHWTQVGMAAILASIQSEYVKRLKADLPPDQANERLNRGRQRIDFFGLGLPFISHPREGVSTGPLDSFREVHVDCSGLHTKVNDHDRCDVDWVRWNEFAQHTHASVDFVRDYAPGPLFAEDQPFSPILYPGSASVTHPHADRKDGFSLHDNALYCNVAQLAHSGQLPESATHVHIGQGHGTIGELCMNALSWSLYFYWKHTSYAVEAASDPASRANVHRRLLIKGAFAPHHSTAAAAAAGASAGLDELLRILAGGDTGDAKYTQWAQTCLHLDIVDFYGASDPRPPPATHPAGLLQHHPLLARFASVVCRSSLAPGAAAPGTQGAVVRDTPTPGTHSAHARPPPGIRLGFGFK